MKTSKPKFSYEFFPPRTDAGRTTLTKTRQELAELKPEFFSVTYGAGGSTKANTLETVVDIQHNSPVDAAPHITCVGVTNAEILELLEQYRLQDIKRLVVLRGDHPLQEQKLADSLKVAELRPADADEIFELLGAHPGSLGAVGVENEPRLLVIEWRGSHFDPRGLPADLALEEH